MSILSLFASKGPSGFGYDSTAEDVTVGTSLEGRSVLVTGCNSGLGLETIRVLALRGARVLGTARTLQKAKAACDSVGGTAVPFACELSEPASVLACVEAVKSSGIALDAIVCNAGIMALPKLEKAFGCELQFFTNHIGHFLLVTGLLEQLTESGRVVMVSSSAHEQAPKTGIELDNLDGSKGYRPWRAYGQSKLANILFAKELSRRFEGTGRTANAVHPGAVQTNLGRNMNPILTTALSLVVRPFVKNVQKGAATQVFVATHPSLMKVSGRYFADCNESRARAEADDPRLAAQLWQVSTSIAADVALGAW